MPRQDPRLVYRLVGFLEYGKSLELLDRFVKTASVDELKIADEIVRQQDQFAVYTNLSRKIEGASFFREGDAGDGEGSYRRHGLDWNMALARVELGAMLAGFTSHRKPFGVVNPTDYEGDAYREILTDGMRAHYWSLKQDRVVQNLYKSGIPKGKLLTYGRRAMTTLALLEAVNNLPQFQLSSIQTAELNAMTEAVKKLQLATMYCLYQKLSLSNRSRRSLTNFEGCTSLKAAAEREMRNPAKGKSGTSFKFTNPFLLRDPSLIKIPCN